ncbi:MAG TPA: hypothetical protein VK961_22750 [Chthoniobacter sp.]|nr:hypothetical protein [Chthoniobacter sp.]
MWFLIVYGKRQREKHLGYAADYCPVCRKVQAFEILEKRHGVHVWFIPVEKGDLLGHAQICGGCQTESESFLTQFRNVSGFQGKSLEALIAKTNPDVRKANAERLALAHQLAADVDKIDEPTRHRLIMEAFSLAESHFVVGFGHHGRRILTVSLRPLWPKEEEIRACLQRYRDAGSRMGARLRTADVMALLYPETEVKDPNKFSY